MIRVDVEVDPADLARVTGALASLQHRLTPNEGRRFLERKVQPYIRNRTIVRFAREGDDASGKWAALSPSTQGIRAVQARRFGWPITPAHPINERSGELRSFVINTYDVTLARSAATLAFPRRNPSRRLRQKITAAQTGTPTGRRLARPVLALGSTDERDVTNMAAKWWDKIVESL